MLSIVFAACFPSGDSGEEKAPPLDTSPAETCDDHAPVIGEFVVEEGKVLTTEDGTQSYPSSKFRWEMTDEDSDLNRFGYRIWVAVAGDGSANQSGTPLVDSEHELKDGECTSGSGGFSYEHGVNGLDLAYETAYDATLIVTDMHGADSEPKSATFTTPGPLQ